MFKWLSQRKSKENSQPKIGQVPAEVIDPIEVDNTSLQVPSDSLRALLRTAITDAEKIADSIKASAEKEAEAETSRIIAQTELNAQKIKGEAELAAQKQAEEIISEAKKQAAITEVALKHRALQFLISASEEAKKEISGDYNEAYSRLSSSLQNIMTESENIERLLKDKATNLWENKNLELKEFETMLLATSETTISTPETPVDSEPDTDITETAEEPVILEEKTIEETVEEPIILEEKTIEELTEKPVALEEKTIEEIAEKPTKGKKKKTRDNGNGGKKHPQVIIDDNKQFIGTIELSIASPVELKLVSKLYDFLQTVPELRVLYTKGSWDRGTTITVVLEQTMPLIDILSKAPEFRVTAEMLEAGNPIIDKSNTLLRGEEHPMQRIKLTLEEK